VINYIGENYLGKFLAHVTLKKVPQKQLFLDFRGVSIGNFKVNGVAVADQGGVSSFRNHKVFIPTEALKIGEDQTNIVSRNFHGSKMFRLKLISLTSIEMMVAVSIHSPTPPMVSSIFTLSLRPITAIGSSQCLTSLTSKLNGHAQLLSLQFGTL
jgi:hypothetical protein